MEWGPLLEITAVSVLFTLLEFLLPTGGIKRSAAMALRLSALLCVAGILLEWMG